MRKLLVVLLALVAAPAAGAVVGGSSMRVSSAPWAVVVRQYGAAVCSGSIIDQRHVVTAAHCVVDGSGTPLTPDVLAVTAGVSNAGAPLPTDARQDRQVAGVRVDPGFRPSETLAVDDVAVLTLATPFDLGGPAVRAIALPPTGAPFPANARLGLAGFGRHSAQMQPNGALRWMSPIAEPQGQCGSVTSAVAGDDDTVTLCAAARGAAVCDGDSGAGLVTTTGKPVIVGVVDSAPAGCVPGTQAVYAYLGAPELHAFVDGRERPTLSLLRRG